MTLYVHHGARLDLLADELAERLATPLADPFATEVVAVPTAGVRDLVVRHAARRLGVAANIDFPFPGKFIATALGRNPDVADPWEIDRLTWAVLGVLESGTVDVPGWAAACQTRRSRRYAMARRIADLFDRYAANRPEVLQQWSAGAPGDGTIRDASSSGSAPDHRADDRGDEQLVGALDAGFEWQFRLWRAVRAAIGVPGPAEQLPELLDALRSGGIEPALPERVAWFGVNALPPARLAVLTALAVRRHVHLSVIHPSPAAWEATAPQPSGWLVHRRRFEELAAAEPEGNPLLRSWGRGSVELAALVNGAATPSPRHSDHVVIDAVVAPAPSDSSLLARLQADIVADRPPAQQPASSAAEPDGSIQVHACHGPTRQLEVLRDVLGQLFVADPTLEPRDVVVLCPDLSRFEPFAAAVFGRGTLPVPVVVTDLSLGSENPIARALVEILRVVAGRCTALDLLTVATLEPVRRRLGLTVDDVDRIAGWIGQLGTSWGVDSAQRAEVLGTELGDGTWDATLRALLVGAAMPAPEPRVASVGPSATPVVPFDDMPADAVVTAGRLAELVARLRHVRRRFTGMAPAGAWCDGLAETLALLCDAEPADAWQLAAVTDAIEEVRQAAAGNPAELAAEDVRAIVDSIVADHRGRLRTRSGSVTMTGLAPLRNVPARVVCLLGFDEASLRSPGVDGDDLLALRPCVGEPDRRAERRQFVLDALLAARQHLVVVCDGSDITTNRRVRFAVPLTELLDVVDTTLTGRPPVDERDSPVVTRHPLRAYDEASYQADAPFGFDDAMVRAAHARRAGEENAAAPAVRRWELPAAPSVVGGTVTLDELVEACTRPARTLLRQRLDVRLPGDVVDIDTSIPLAVSPLESAVLGRRLLDRYRTSAALAHEGLAERRQFDRAAFERTVLDDWHRAESLAGRLPPGDLVRQSLDDVARELSSLVDTAVAKVGGPLDHLAVLGASDTLDIDIAVLPSDGDPDNDDPDNDDTASPWRVVDRIGSIADAGRAGSAICRLSYTRPKARTFVEAALHLAAAVVATGRTDWIAVTATRGANRSAKATGTVLGVQGGIAGAQQLLDAAATIRAAALRGAVPLFEEASRGLYETGFLDEEALAGNDFKRGDLGDLDTGFVWSGATTADILRLGPGRWAQLLWGSIADFVFDWSDGSDKK